MLEQDFEDDSPQFMIFVLFGSQHAVLLPLIAINNSSSGPILVTSNYYKYQSHLTDSEDIANCSRLQFHNQS